MENGDIMKAELYPDIAPNTVKNFISLINKGFYDGLIFHQGDQRFMIQGGCPDGTGMGGPGYTIKGEFAQMVSPTIWHMIPGYFPWPARCIRTLQEASSYHA